MTLRKCLVCGCATVVGAGCGGIKVIELGSDRYDMIDDMEDQNSFLIRRPDRSGRWATYNDDTPTAMQWPPTGGNFTVSAIDPPRGSSRFAVRTHGQGFDKSGLGWASIVAEFVPSTDAGLGFYDASAFIGLRFWAKIGPGSQAPSLSVGDLQTDPKGGVCNKGTNGDADC